MFIYAYVYIKDITQQQSIVARVCDPSGGNAWIGHVIDPSRSVRIGLTIILASQFQAVS